MPDAMIDLGGIAKGYIADKMKDYLNEKDITSGMINLGQSHDSRWWKVWLQYQIQMEPYRCYLGSPRGKTIYQW